MQHTRRGPKSHIVGLIVMAVALVAGLAVPADAASNPTRCGLVGPQRAGSTNPSAVGIWWEGGDGATWRVWRNGRAIATVANNGPGWYVDTGAAPGTRASYSVEAVGASGSRRACGRTRVGGTAEAAAAPVSNAGLSERGVVLPFWNVRADNLEATFAELDAIKALGATSVSLLPTWYSPNQFSSRIARRPGVTPSDAVVGAVIDAAHQRGLKVTLKPHIDLDNRVPRLFVKPLKPRKWFRNYRRVINRYADIAARHNVERLTIGSELGTTLRWRNLWRGTVAQVRARYGGQISYAANWDRINKVRFWDRLDFIAVNAFWPVSSGPTTDVATLVRGWERGLSELSLLSRRTGKRVLLTEAGYFNVVGATVEPWREDLGTARSDETQRAAYEALVRAFDPQPWFAGVHWWHWFQNSPTGYAPINRPAASLIGARFR